MMAIYQLPTFKGYTIDLRLREFRKVNQHEPIEFVDFNSDKGDELLEAWMDEKPEQFAAAVKHYVDSGLGTSMKFEWILFAQMVEKEKSETKAEVKRHPKKDGNGGGQ